MPEMSPKQTFRYLRWVMVWVGSFSLPAVAQSEVYQLPANIQQTAALKAVVSETNPVPFAMFSAEGQLVGGLSKNLLDRVAAALDTEVQYLDVPRARVEQWLISGKADIGCFLAPDWVVSPTLLHWAGPLFYSAQLVVRQNSSKPIRQLSDLYHQRIGTIRGYVYPELEQAFAEHLLVRDDAHSLESNLTRLAQGRLDAVMTVDLSLGYVLQKQKFAAVLSYDVLWTEAPAIYCAVSKSSPLQARISAVFTTLQQQGAIDAMLLQYKPNVLPGAELRR